RLGRRALLGRRHLPARRVGCAALLALALGDSLGVTVAARGFLVVLRRRLQIARGRETLALALGRLRAGHDVYGQRPSLGLPGAVARGHHGAAPLLQRRAPPPPRL